MPDETTTPVTPVASTEERAKRSNRSIKYNCTECGRDVGRENLKVKRTQFKEMGVSGPIIQSRVVGWLCVVPADDGGPSCLEADPAWKQPERVATPGLADTRVGKEHAAKHGDDD